FTGLVAGCIGQRAPELQLTVQRESHTPGNQPDGSVLLPNQWSLHPAGRQIELRDFPVNIAVHPSGRYVAVLHSGYSVNVVTIVDLSISKIVSHANIDQSFYGLVFSANGDRLFCSGAGQERIHSFLFQNGNLTGHEEIQLRDIQERGVPAGLAIDRAGRTLFAANLWGDRISQIDLHDGRVVTEILLQTNTSPLLKAEAPEHDPDV